MQLTPDHMNLDADLISEQGRVAGGNTVSGSMGLAASGVDRFRQGICLAPEYGVA